MGVRVFAAEVQTAEGKHRAVCVFDSEHDARAFQQRMVKTGWLCVFWEM